MPPLHSGFVALVGRPNAGKSTLLNRILGEHVSITSDKPQTTRNRVVGIHNDDGMQAVLVDTPGIHTPHSELNASMVRAATASMADVDAICWVVDALAPIAALREGHPVFLGGVEQIAALVVASRKPATVALNKVDKAEPAQLLPVIAAFAARLPDAAIVPVSAQRGTGVDRLLAVWRGQLPEGPRLFPADQLMDVSEKFLVAELVREKLFRLTSKEVPYAAAVEVERFEEEPDDRGERTFVRIWARILVERDSQKAIVIGKGGSMLRKIGTAARQDIEKLLGARVHLDLHVVVRKDWTKNRGMLKTLGYE